MSTIRGTLRRVRHRAIIAAAPVLYRRDVQRDDMLRIGSTYGGWWVPASLLNAESVCYLGGVGTDITFDLGLVGRFGCDVWAIDPTPQTIAWLAEQDLDPRFHHLAEGLAGASGELVFHRPAHPGHVSHSIKNLQRTSGGGFVAKVCTVAELMQRLGHGHLDLLKLDIEGAEHETIARALADGVLPGVLCVEFDQPEPLSWSRRTVRLLHSHGYRIVAVEGLNVTFVREPDTPDGREVSRVREPADRTTPR